ncbi:MAG: hypothetical protein QG602_1226 [Verrucomicrobiota bacterium]|nr:hypothetical protein [Verrucomicrobiota bacterium]
MSVRKFDAIRAGYALEAVLLVVTLALCAVGIAACYA